MDWKKLFSLSVGMYVFLLSSHAQIAQGSWLIGGDVGFGFSNVKNSYTLGSTTISTLGNTSNFILSPRVGFFVIDNLAVGVNVDFSGSSYTEKDGADTEKDAVTRLAVGPFARYYLALGQVYPFIEAGINFGSANYISSFNNSETRTTHRLNNMGAGPGVAFFVADNVAVEALVKYNRSVEKYDGSGGSEIKMTTGGILVAVGVQAYIRR